MSNLAQIAETVLKVERGKVPLAYVPKYSRIIARAQLGSVFLFMDNSGVEMSTLTAHHIGYTIAMMVPNLAPDELIVIVINGEQIQLLPEVAQKVSTALLRKADDADDWQLQNKRIRA